MSFKPQISASNGGKRIFVAQLGMRDFISAGKNLSVTWSLQWRKNLGLDIL